MNTKIVIIIILICAVFITKAYGMAGWVNQEDNNKSFLDKPITQIMNKCGIKDHMSAEQKELWLNFFEEQGRCCNNTIERIIDTGIWASFFSSFYAITHDDPIGAIAACCAMKVCTHTEEPLQDGVSQAQNYLQKKIADVPVDENADPQDTVSSNDILVDLTESLSWFADTVKVKQD